MDRTDKWIGRLRTIDQAYRSVFSEMVPRPRAYFAVSAALSVVNVVALKSGVAAKVAALLS